MTEIDWSESEEKQRQTSLGQSIYWLKAVAFQGQRVLEAVKVPIKHSNSVLYNSRSRMEQMFFLIACQKAVRWLKPMKLNTPEATAFSVFNKSIGEVRNEREHDEDRYGLGNKFDTSIGPHEHAIKGHIYKKGKTSGHTFQMKQAETVGGVSLVTSLCGTVYSGGRILIGGILDVSEVMIAAEALISSLLIEQHKNSDQLIGRGRTLTEAKQKIAESHYIDPFFEE